LPYQAQGFQLPDFYSGATDQLGCLTEGFLLRRLYWSEKGTVRGVLGPVLDHYAVGFRVMHGFSGATTIYDVSQNDDGRQLIVLYVGDYDPSGMFMSEADLPARLSKYGGDHIKLVRLLRRDPARSARCRWPYPRAHARLAGVGRRGLCRRVAASPG
jgi:hypothetical protein